MSFSGSLGWRGNPMSSVSAAASLDIPEAA
jgi:hypothetical protein